MKLRALCTALAALLGLTACAHAEVTLLAASVGKGDALILRSGEYVCLIDTGKSDAQAQVENALQAMNVTRLDAVFITHTDKDHTGGLKWLRKSDLEIGAIYASAWHPDTEEKKHPAVKTAEKLGLQVNWLRAGDSVPMGSSGAVLQVLAPQQEIPGNEDDNSLVMMLESPDGRMLLTGDMEYYEEALLIESGADLKCDVLKVANHGDGDATSTGFVRACAPQLALISTSGEEKPGTPDPVVVSDLEEAGAAVYVTESCTLGVRVTLKDGSATAEYLN